VKEQRVACRLGGVCKWMGFCDGVIGGFREGERAVWATPCTPGK